MGGTITPYTWGSHAFLILSTKMQSSSYFQLCRFGLSTKPYSSSPLTSSIQFCSSHPLSSWQLKRSMLYFEWVEGGKNNFLKPKFKKLIKYYILLFCFEFLPHPPGGGGGGVVAFPPRSSNSSILVVVSIPLFACSFTCYLCIYLTCFDCKYSLN